MYSREDIDAKYDTIVMVNDSLSIIGLTTGAMILSAISMPPCQKLHIARPGRGPSISPATAAAILRSISFYVSLSNPTGDCGADLLLLRMRTKCLQQ